MKIHIFFTKILLETRKGKLKKSQLLVDLSLLLWVQSSSVQRKKRKKGYYNWTQWEAATGDGELRVWGESGENDGGGQQLRRDVLLISLMGVRGQAGIVMSPWRDVFQMLRSQDDKGVAGEGGEGGGRVEGAPDAAGQYHRCNWFRFPYCFHSKMANSTKCDSRIWQWRWWGGGRWLLLLFFILRLACKAR